MAKKNKGAAAPEDTPDHVSELPAEEEIAARTAPEAEPGNVFRKTFVLQTFDEDEVDESFHNANKVAVLQEALNRGLHAVGEPEYGGHDVRHDKSVEVHYFVEVVPAHADDSPADAVTPASHLETLGGSTHPI